MSSARMLEEDADEGEVTFLFKSRSAVLEDERRPLAGGQQLDESSEDELGRLDIDLDRKSRRHNLTSGNVRTILHEVITHERVVDMMKAAISATQDMPMFEPKMTRSRLKRAMQQGQCLDWSLLAEQSLPHPQFVDIHLDADEDSSDEEYCPGDEDDEDTAEETFLSDGDVISPDKVQDCDSSSQGHSMLAPVQFTDAAGPSFLERLNAVEEELNCGPALASLPTHRTGEEEGEGSSGLAFRTRSKLPLVNIPLEQLEAELLAPDITADMYDQSPARKEEDRHWARWLHGLMAANDEEDADDEDDPEYNFLDDLDEPDLEDYRTDRAVQITKREVNELLEELFDTLQFDQPAEEEEEEEGEEHPVEGEEQEAGPNFNVPQPLCLQPPLAGMLTAARRRALRQAAVQHRRALRDTTNRPWPACARGPWMLPSPLCPTSAHRLQLQQQIQQHVQLLTEVHLLSRGVLKHEAAVTKHFLVSQEELAQFAVRREQLLRASSFRARNLQGALDLLQEVERRVALPRPPPAVSKRWLPVMSSSTIGHAFPVLPSDSAWLLATRPVFLYPELLPVCSLDPSHHTRGRCVFTAGEDGLIVLGLKHFEGAVQPEHLISSYLLCKSVWKLTKHIRDMSSSRAPPENVLKMFLARQLGAPLPLACARVQPEDRRPPVDKDASIMPVWLKNSREVIQKTQVSGCSPCYPHFLPRGCNLKLYPSRLKTYIRQPGQRRLFTLAHNASLHPICPAEPNTDPLLSSWPNVGAPSAAVPCSGAGYFLLESGAASLLLPSAAARPKPVGTPNAPMESHVRRPQHGHGAARDEKAADRQRAGCHQTGEGEEAQKQQEEERDGGQEEERGADEGGQGEEEGREGQREQEEQGGEEEGHREEEEQGDGEKDEEQEKQEEDEEEEEEDEDFDELTQDEDEEEAMSSASEESLLSIPELQETMKQLAWLASSRRRPDAESEEDHSPTSQEEEEEEEAPKGDQAGGRTATAASEDDDDDANTGEEEAPRGGRRGGARRGRGQQSRGLGGPRRARHKKDPSKASLLYDENMLENDPQRQSKDVAFARSYLNRVGEALRDVPEKMEEFVSLLRQLEGQLEGRAVAGVFRKLRRILGKRTDLTRDFAAFLHPEQALECGLFQEQQAFERSRRFLRQLEITFGDNPSHYSKIIKALQPGPHLSASDIDELKAQMAALLKGHPHLQAEFWVFFDELRPPQARPGQFEDARWPEECGAEGADGGGHPSGGVADGAFEEVTLPDEDRHKLDAALSRRQRRKLRSRAADQESDWPCLCHRSKSRTHSRRGCARCHGNKVRLCRADNEAASNAAPLSLPVQGSGGVSRATKSLDPLSASEDKDGEPKVADCSRAGAPAWERSFPSADDEEAGGRDEVESPPAKRKREEELHSPSLASPPPDLPVCAKNISVMPSGEKVILWTREADRVILTTCRQEGANVNTFQGIAGLLGNKTPSEVSRRFRDLMRLFQSAARHAGSDDEAPPSELEASEEQD